MIPKQFKRYCARKRLKMTVEQAWAKWEPYWPLRQNGPNCLPYGDTYVLGRYGDEGEYTVDNCRVITHRANTLERDHTKCADKLRGTVHNPAGGRTVPKHRRHNGDRRVVTPRGEFEDCAKAAQAYGMHRSSVWHRVNSDRYPDFHWRSFA